MSRGWLMSDDHIDVHSASEDGAEDCALDSHDVAPQAPDQLDVVPASAAAVAPVQGSDQVLMTLALSNIGDAHFLLSHVDAVVLAAQLLDAARFANDQIHKPPPGTRPS